MLDKSKIILLLINIVCAVINTGCYLWNKKINNIKSKGEHPND